MNRGLVMLGVIILTLSAVGAWAATDAVKRTYELEGTEYGAKPEQKAAWCSQEGADYPFCESVRGRAQFLTTLFFMCLGLAFSGLVVISWSSRLE